MKDAKCLYTLLHKPVVGKYPEAVYKLNIQLRSPPFFFYINYLPVCFLFKTYILNLNYPLTFPNFFDWR